MGSKPEFLFPLLALPFFICVKRRGELGVEEFSILQTLADYGIGVLFGGFVYYMSRRDHADMLRREQQFSASQETTIKMLAEVSHDTAEAITKLERQLHEVKNALQRNTYALERVAPTFGRGQSASSEENEG